MNGDKEISVVQAIRGPIVMITIGVLFLLDHTTAVDFSRTWPVILIVLGVLALAGGSRWRGPGRTGPRAGGGQL